MLGKKVAIITNAGLESALAKIIALTEGDIKIELVKLGEDLKAYGEQPLPLDPDVEKRLKAYDTLKLEADGKDQLIIRQKEELTVASNTVRELKVQLEEALAVKAEKSDQLIVEVKKVRYIVNHGSFPHSAKEIAENPEIAAELLKIEGQNVLTKLK